MKSGLLVAVAAGALLAAAPATAQGVKIGILNDQSGVYADYGGKYSVEAARMAIEDFGGQVLGQALSAAVQTLGNDRHVHSMHAYFLRPGDASKPIVTYKHDSAAAQALNQVSHLILYSSLISLASI